MMSLVPVEDSERTLIQRLPHKVYVHYVPIEPMPKTANPCRKLRAEAVNQDQLTEGTRYEVLGVAGCSAPHQRDVDLMVTISVDRWETHIVSGKDLLTDQVARGPRFAPTLLLEAGA